MNDNTGKSDRALELRLKGLGRVEIAERLGVPESRVQPMIERAKKRRAAASAKLEKP